MSITLLCMPYHNLPRPSLALGLLKAHLTGAGLACRVRYANLEWAELNGLDDLALVGLFGDHILAQEWTFSGAAFGPEAPSPEGLLAEIERSWVSAKLAEVRETLLRIRSRALPFIEQLAFEVVRDRPRVVGCSSTFQQHCASLAVLRRIKELDPTIVTVIGGANCEAEMGWCNLQAFDWLDVVVSGEADGLIVPLLQGLLERGLDAPMPYGALTRAAPAPTASVRATASRLDALPLPDFDDYFEQVARLALAPSLIHSLPLESSRGCWWGERHHCTFCGLNGHGMGYRTKSGPRFLEEIRTLSERYATAQIEMVDNILDLGYLKTVMPALEGSGLRLFYETKANLRAEQVEQLKRAGVVGLQPGIESLHDDILRLLDKGATAATNVQMLRRARQHGIRLAWLFLANIPGERDEWYAEMAEWLPWICHLQPPQSVVPVRYDRFSP